MISILFSLLLQTPEPAFHNAPGGNIWLQMTWQFLLIYRHLSMFIKFP